MNTLKRMFAPCEAVGMLPVRLSLFATFFYHGTQKLFGWFGGGGIEGTAAFLGSLGVPLATVAAYPVALLEVLGAAAFLVGAGVRFFGLLLSLHMLAAIFLVHLRNGWDFTKGGIEFNVAIIAMCLAVAMKGPGHHSIEWADEEGAAPEAVS